METTPLLVIKKDGRREPFSREKVLQGVLRACSKRDVPLSRLEDLVADVQGELRSELLYEVSSEHVGDMVLDRLQDLGLCGPRHGSLVDVPLHAGLAIDDDGYAEGDELFDLLG